MARRTLNFDNFMSEKKTEYVTVTVYGKAYKIKQQIPAIVPVMMARADESTAQGEVMLAVLRAGDIIFGKDTINEFTEKGMSADELAALIQQTFSLISNTDVDGDDVDDDTAEYDDESSKVVAPRRRTKK